MRCYKCGGYRFNPDEDIRRLERNANLGDVNAEAKLIIAKVRAGIIPTRYVALAAYLGDKVALATGIEPWDDAVVLVWARSSDIINVIMFGDLTYNILIASVTDFAEHVLHVFENAYPNDDRPRLAIQAARSDATSSDAITDAWNSYSNASSDGNWTAADAAHAAWCAASAAYYRYSPYSWAADSSNSAYYAIRNNSEIEWQQNRLCDYLLDRRKPL